MRVAVGVGLGFAIVFVAVFFGVQWFTRSGVFRVPGVVYFDESLTEAEKAAVATVFDDEIDLDKDVTITARSTLELGTLQENEYIYNIYVPVTDFYSLETNITVERADDLLRNCTDCGYKMVPVDELDFQKKLLSVNGRYYLDDFKAGAIFRIIRFDSEKYDEEIAPLVAKLPREEFPEAESVLTMAQTGVTAMSRGMKQKLDAVGDATFFAAEIGGFLSAFDLTHTSNEASFSEYASAANICSDPQFFATLEAIGLDIVELTGNHNLDCGDEAAIQTVDLYREKGIKIVGGGKTATEAAEPLEIKAKGNGITMLAFNESTGGATDDNTPGANRYDEARAAMQIREAKARGDTVIVDVQYYECSMYVSDVEDNTCDYANSSAGDQVGFFRHLVDLGADVVVGTSAHQPQTYELYQDGAIYYGLGNLFFDQVWWPGTTRSLILVHYFYHDKLVQTRIMPTAYDGNMQTRLLDASTTRWFLDRLQSVKPNQDD